MAKQIFAANRIAGGVSGALDDISYTSLEDSNIAIVIQTSDNKTYFYKYDSSNNNVTNPESSPNVIIPDDNSTGTGAWILEGCTGATLKSEGTLVVDGASTLTGTVGTGGNVNVGGDLDVTGSSTLADLELGGTGATADEISTDGTLAGNSDTAIPTEKAVKTYADSLQSNYNYIINGQMEINQRADASWTTNGDYTVDRMKMYLSGTSATLTVTQESLSVSDTEALEGNPLYTLQGVASSGSTSAGEYIILSQRIEDVRKFAGKTISISFVAKSGSSSDISVSIAQFFGSGGSPSATVVTHVDKVTTTTSYAKYTMSVAVPSISGKTLGTDGDFTDIRLWLSAGSDSNTETDTLGFQSDTFNITNLKVEEGSVVTPFVPRLLAEEQAMCQRYYQIVRAGFTGNVVTTVSYYGNDVPMPVRMRATPTCVGVSQISVSGFAALATADTTGLSVYGFTVRKQPSATGVTKFYRGNWIFEAEL